MPITHIVATIFMKLVVLSPEGDGSWNQLLEIHDPRHNNPKISFSSKEPLPYKEGQSFDAWVDMKCFDGFGVDESITTSWVTFSSRLCDADLLMVEGDSKPRTAIVRPNSEATPEPADKTESKSTVKPDSKAEGKAEGKTPNRASDQASDKTSDQASDKTSDQASNKTYEKAEKAEKAAGIPTAPVTSQATGKSLPAPDKPVDTVRLPPDNQPIRLDSRPESSLPGDLW